MTGTIALLFALFFAISKVLLSWLVIFACLTGLGLLVRRAMRLRMRSLTHLLTSFWIGWCATVAFLQIWHIFFRVGWASALVVALAGAAGLAWNARDVRAWFVDLFAPARRGAAERRGATDRRSATERRRATLIWFAAFAVMTGLVADFAIGPPTVGDTGLYHMNAVRWASEYPIVPGLGNLNGRLAFNNSSFLYMALLEWGPWRGMSHHLGNGLLSVVLLAQVTAGIRRAFDTRDALWPRHAFMAMLFLPVFVSASKHASSSSPNLPVLALGVVTAFLLFTLVFRPEPEASEAGEAGEAGEDGFLVFATCLIAAVGLSVKLSFAAVGFASALLAVYWHLARRGPPRGAAIRRRGARTAAVVALAVALVVAPWMLRGVYLSGYPAYPMSAGGAPVEWRMPVRSVVRMNRKIRSWARTPGAPTDQVLGSREWLAPWFRRSIKKGTELTAPLLLLVLGLGILISSLGKGVRQSAPSWAPWLLVAPAGFALVFWFLTAPDVRFVGASSWALAAGVAVLAMHRLCPTGKAFRRASIALVVLVAVSYVYCLKPALRRAWGPGRVASGPQPKGTRRGSANGFHPAPVAATKEARTRSGLVVNVLSDPEAHQLWDAPLPCARRVDPYLRLRRPGDLASGLVLDPAPEDPADPGGSTGD